MNLSRRYVSSWIVPGALADYHARIGGPVTSPSCRILCKPLHLGGQTLVVNIEGVAGFVACAALTPSKAPHAVQP